MYANLTQKYTYFHFNSAAFKKEFDNSFLSNGFVLKIRLNELPQDNQVLFNAGGFLLSFVRKKANDENVFTVTEKADRVWLYQDDDGYVSLLEMQASFSDGEKTREIVCDLVLKLFDVTKKDGYFVYDGVRFFWAYDGETANQEYPFGEPVKKDERFIDARLGNIELAPITAMQEEEKVETKRANMAFYSPRGYNCWAGDVVNYYKDGVYHLLYFHDRHHHHSRFGAGAHTMYHLTTKDFINWEDHGALIKLDKQWKTVGTGTMFFHQGKYYYSHGFHTSRMVKVEQTGSKLLQERATENVVCGATYEEIEKAGLYPSGANYVVSNDGIHFEMGNYQFHLAENPSVYVEPDGTLTMYAGYGGGDIWKADTVQGPWKKDGNFFINQSLMQPSTECPSKFELNGYQYLLVGGTGYFKTEKDGTEFHDEAIKGYDVYDGMFVPMVAKTDGGRLLYGGWLNGYGWASVIVQRELIQGENGRLFMRWLSELAPKKEELEEVSGFVMQEENSYYFEADVKPCQNGKVGIRLVGEEDCQLCLDSEQETIQISKIEKQAVFAPAIKPLHEEILNGANKKDVQTSHYLSEDFCLPKADCLKNSYKVKMIIYYEKKLGGVIIDAEIGGKRTLVSNRVEKRFKTLSWVTEQAELSNAKLYQIK